MSPTRSLQHSEAQLMARCAAAVEQCRRDLGDLRAACKAAASYREKCTELLGAATEAVVSLEDMLYDPGIDLRRERALQGLATRVQAALDQVTPLLGAGAGRGRASHGHLWGYPPAHLAGRHPLPQQPVAGMPGSFALDVLRVPCACKCVAPGCCRASAPLAQRCWPAGAARRFEIFLLGGPTAMPPIVSAIAA